LVEADGCWPLPRIDSIVRTISKWNGEVRRKSLQIPVGDAASHAVLGSLGQLWREES
jgi:hypothetical protein